MTGTALMLAAHGSRRCPEVNAAVRQVAADLRGLPGYDEVLVGFHQGEPGFTEALRACSAERIIVVPLMTSRGHYVDRVLPRALAQGAAQRASGGCAEDKRGRPALLVGDAAQPIGSGAACQEVQLQTDGRQDNVATLPPHVTITEPVGRHPGMRALLAGRITDLLRDLRLDPQTVTVALVGHGTRRNPHSRRTTVHWASQLSYANVAGQVLAGFIDDEPGVEAMLTRARYANILVVPFLIGAGHHAMRDIPRALGMMPAGTPGKSPVAAAWNHPFPHGRGAGALPRTERRGDGVLVVDRPIGQDPQLVRLIDELARNPALRRTPAVPRRPLRLGTRGSRLALWQAQQVADPLRSAGWPVEVIALTTTGDRDLLRPIADLPGAAPFVDDLERALSAGMIDLAVHSRKDLATDMSPELTLAAVLPRGDAREALVARDHRTLAQLPVGATVGTSSPRRAAQVHALRPDVRLCPLRGAVDERVRVVRRGELDAAVLAAAGLARLNLLHEACEIFPIETFVPAPAQAALVVQARAGDELAAQLAADLDDRSTRLATDLEWRILEAFAGRADCTVAAYAEVTTQVRLHVRLFLKGSDTPQDIHAAGKTVDDVFHVVLPRLTQLRRLPNAAAQLVSGDER